MANLPSLVKDNLGNILTAVTLLGLGVTYLATKDDVGKVGKSVNILRIEITTKINDDRLNELDAITDKTPANIREVEALVESNKRMEAQKEELIHAVD